MTEWRDAHRELYNDYFRSYFKNYPAHSVHVRQWAAANHPKLNDEARQRYHDTAYRDKYLARKSAWRRDNPERASAIAQRTRKKHTLKRPNLQSKAPGKNLRSLQTPFKRQCACPHIASRMAYASIAANLLHGVYHVDHVMPLSRGGSNAPENIVLACQRCKNDSKHNHTVSEWLSAIKTRKIPSLGANTRMAF